jgi:arylsulfatase A-like enzyme
MPLNLPLIPLHALNSNGARRRILKKRIYIAAWMIAAPVAGFAADLAVYRFGQSAVSVHSPSVTAGDWLWSHTGAGSASYSNVVDGVNGTDPYFKAFVAETSTYSFVASSSSPVSMDEITFRFGLFSTEAKAELTSSVTGAKLLWAVNTGGFLESGDNPADYTPVAAGNRLDSYAVNLHPEAGMQDTTGPVEFTWRVVSGLADKKNVNFDDVVLRGTTNTASINTRPNIVLFLSDDQSYFDYGVTGNPNVPTLATDRLAEEGMFFSRTYTVQAICAPSRSALYTGLYPLRNGCFLNHDSVRDGTRTVYNHLVPLGYDVILAGKSHVKPSSVFRWSQEWPSVEVVAGANEYIPLDQINSYLSTATNKPFCLIVASHYPHPAYLDQTTFSAEDVLLPPYLTESDRNAYVGYYGNILIKERDELDGVLNALDTHGLSTNTVFLYTSDHGAKGGKYTCYSAGLHVPMIVRWPGVVQPGGHSSALISFVDILPTLIDICGGTPPAELDGHSFLDVLLGKKTTHNQRVYGVMSNQGLLTPKVFPIRTVISDRYGYVHNFNAKERVIRLLEQGVVVNPFFEQGADTYPNRKEEEFFALDADPWELTNLAENVVYTETKTILQKQLADWMVLQGDYLAYDEDTPVFTTGNLLDQDDPSHDYYVDPPELIGTLTDFYVDPQATPPYTQSLPDLFAGFTSIEAGSNGAVVIDIRGAPMQHFSLQTSTNLLDWIDTQTWMLSYATNRIIREENANRDHLFYRLKKED